MLIIKSGFAEKSVSDNVSSNLALVEHFAYNYYSLFTKRLRHNKPACG